MKQSEHFSDSFNFMIISFSLSLFILSFVYLMPVYVLLSRENKLIETVYFREALIIIFTAFSFPPSNQWNDDFDLKFAYILHITCHVFGFFLIAMPRRCGKKERKKKTINSNMIKMLWKNQVFHPEHYAFIYHTWYSNAILFAFGWQLMSWCQRWGAQMLIEWKNAKIIHTIQELSMFLHNLFLVFQILFISGKIPI